MSSTRNWINLKHLEAEKEKKLTFADFIISASANASIQVVYCTNQKPGNRSFQSEYNRHLAPLSL